MADLREALAQLAGAVQTLTVTAQHDVQQRRDDAAAAAAAAAAQPPPPPPAPPQPPPPLDYNALATAFSTASAPTREYNGQPIRLATFDVNTIDHDNPADDEHYALPAEPRYPPDHAMIVKNESALFRFIERNRVDPRKASRSHFDKVFLAKVSSPFKTVIFDHPSYEDYIRNTTIVYTAMQVWYSRFMPDGKNEFMLDDDSPFIMWNAYTKETMRVKRAQPRRAAHTRNLSASEG